MVPGVVDGSLLGVSNPSTILAKACSIGLRSDHRAGNQSLAPAPLNLNAYGFAGNDQRPSSPETQQVVRAMLSPSAWWPR